MGFDWPDVAGVRDKVTEELGELDRALADGDQAAIAEELGDLLFTLTRLGAKVGVPPEDALRACIHRFRARFEEMDAAKNKAVEDAYRRARDSAEAVAKASGRTLG